MVDSVQGTVGSVHIYRVDSLVPNSTNGIPSTITSIDTIRYWGVFYAEGPSATSRVTYYYDKNKSYLNATGCVLEWMQRDDNADLTWASTGAPERLLP
ncbi:hypothetical protein KFE98_12905 [bacterium SCSIO 12741]|nr:hypothetical protein KFE98_12905 [bacterium SCSIO 12741]